MVPCENWHMLTLYVAKQDLPRALFYASLQIGEVIW
jgi:hypothetical protein